MDSSSIYVCAQWQNYERKSNEWVNRSDLCLIKWPVTTNCPSSSERPKIKNILLLLSFGWLVGWVCVWWWDSTTIAICLLCLQSTISARSNKCAHTLVMHREQVFEIIPILFLSVHQTWLLKWFYVQYKITVSTNNLTYFFHWTGRTQEHPKFHSIPDFLKNFSTSTDSHLDTVISVLPRHSLLGEFFRRLW